MRQLKPYGSGRRALSYHDINGIILKSRIEYFLNLPLQTVYLIDEEQVTLLKIIQYGGHLAGFFNGRT